MDPKDWPLLMKLYAKAPSNKVSFMQTPVKTLAASKERVWILHKKP